MMELGDNCWAKARVVIIGDQIHLCLLKIVGERMVTNGVFAQLKVISSQDT